MFYEKFDLELDDNTSDYDSDTLIITYYLQNMFNEIGFLEAIQHEWIHGLCEWATEPEQLATEKQDHFILRLLGFGI